MKTLTAEERGTLKSPKYFYEVEFNKPGGLIMPILVELTFEDGTTENFKYPAQIWKNNDTARKVYVTEKQSRKFKLTLS
jgi:hypothetical protein